MWKRKLPSGKWQYGTAYTDPLTGVEHQATITLEKKNDHVGQEQLNRKITELISASGKPEDIRFKDLCEKYIDYQRIYYKKQTAVAAEDRTSAFRQLIGDSAIVSQFTAPLIAGKLYSENAGTYNERLTRFKALIRWGYREDLIENISWLDKLRPMKDQPVREKVKNKYLDDDEIGALLDGMDIDKWKLLTEFLLLSGLRIGEAIALTNEDVDTNARQVHVTKTYSLRISAITTTKTETSYRDVYMQDELLDCCRRIKKYIRMEEMEFAYRSDIFMPDINTGSYMKYDAYRQYLEDHTEKLIGRRLTPHALRHTHVAMLAENGVSLEAIMHRLGHADSKVTKEVYMHVTKKMKEAEEAQIREVKIISDHA